MTQSTTFNISDLLLSYFHRHSIPVWLIDEYLQPHKSSPISPYADEIIPRIHLGSCHAVYASGWTHVVTVQEFSSCVIQLNDSIQRFRIPITDDPYSNLYKYLNLATEWIHDAYQDPSSIILIHCAAGISRSSSLTIAYLMRYHHMGMDQAFEWIKDRRKVKPRPNQGFVLQLRNYQHQLFLSRDIEYATQIIHRALCHPTPTRFSNGLSIGIVACSRTQITSLSQSIASKENRSCYWESDAKYDKLRTACQNYQIVVMSTFKWSKDNFKALSQLVLNDELNYHHHCPFILLWFETDNISQTIATTRCHELSDSCWPEKRQTIEDTNNACLVSLYESSCVYVMLKQYLGESVLSLLVITLDRYTPSSPHRRQWEIVYYPIVVSSMPSHGLAFVKTICYRLHLLNQHHIHNYDIQTTDVLSYLIQAIPLIILLIYVLFRPLHNLLTPLTSTRWLTEKEFPNIHMQN
jgi:protein-tyrosine phosphatase